MRLELARRSVLHAASWRLPKYTAVPFHQELGGLCDRVVDSAFEGTALQALVGAPPRHGKTELIALATPVRVMLEAWRRDEEFPVLYVTAKDTLARRVGRQLRAVAVRLRQETGDPWWDPAPDGEWTAESWETRGGFAFRAIGRGGATGGMGCRLLVLDDLIGHGDVYRSAASRESIRNAVTEDFRTRLMDGGPTIHMETRRGVHDTTAWLLEEQGDQWENHVWKCWTPERGYLWERRMNDGLRAKLGLHDAHPKWLSLYQQEPVPEGGTLIPPEWLETTYPGDPAIQRQVCDQVVIGVDLASTGKTSADECAFVVLGVRGAFRDVLHVHAARMPYTAARQYLRELCDEWRPAAVVVERAAGGDALVDDLRAIIPGIRGESATQDKVARLTPWLPVMQAAQLRLPRSAPWLRRYRETLTTFTGREGGADDMVDATVWALVASDSGAVLTQDHAAELRRVMEG